MATAEQEQHQDADSQRLAELGYKQDLQRAWSSFSNFAISFTIISVLAGCFTTYAFAWNNGGPIAISWGWPIICGLILLVAFSMSELVSAYPTAGGIYWWASELGGKGWGWFTGWFNLVGLVGVVASVVYASAQFANALLSLYGLDLGFMNFGDAEHVLAETFFLFVLFLTLHALVNIYSSPLVAMINNVSVGWHVVGVAIIIAILVLVPSDHQSVDYVFTERINNSGLFDGGLSGAGFWFYVLPLGFLLTMYTQTGYDASAHVSEETKGAALGAAKGVWRAVFWSGLIGWFVLLAITFAATDTEAINSADNGFGLGSSLAIFDTALTSAAAKAVILIATIGQLFCGMACVTSASRMTYAFSRDRAVPGWQLWTRLNHHRVPHFAVLFAVFWAMVVTLPALIGDENNYTYAFYAVVSITVIGLYIAYVMPVYLRWRIGDSFKPGPWTLGKKYKWVNPAAVIWVAICVVVFSLPQGSTGAPWHDDFDFKYVNYAPIAVGVVFAAVGIWWLVSARHKFTGPVRNIQFDEAAGIVEESPADRT
jgi:amino acid transporter